MFTYGYIREATMAHLDIDETEAQAMSLLSRFHIFANEAMQAICSSKPLYKYIDVSVVKKFTPLVYDDSSEFFHEATEQENMLLTIDYKLKNNIMLTLAEEDLAKQNLPLPRTVDIAQTREYYHNKNIYEQYESYHAEDTFISFANKQAYKIVEYKPTVEEELEAEAFGRPLKRGVKQEHPVLDKDYSYIGGSKIKFYKPGHYLIPAKYMWYRFDSGLSDSEELDMPADILTCIPIYIASVCLQIDNPQRAQIKRNEFEIALARCTYTDFMKNQEIAYDWN